MNGIEIRNEELYSLIDRMQKCSEIKYPNRIWNNDFYHECAFQWKDKIDELKQRVLDYEKEVGTCNP